MQLTLVELFIIMLAGVAPMSVIAVLIYLSRNEPHPIDNLEPLPCDEEKRDVWGYH